MARYVVGRGTLLNTATVAAGALIGWAAGRHIHTDYKVVATAALGLVTVGIGVKLFLQSRSVPVVAAALVIGGVLGLLLRIQDGLEAFARWAESAFAGEGAGTFQEAVITTSILYCVGPMTLLGCLQDALEDKIDLLAIKSTMDGFGSIFFAAALGPGVLVTAGVVFVFQGTLTAAASPLRRFAEDKSLVDEATAAGGAMLIAIGLGLLDIKKLPVATLLPALALAPLFASFGQRYARRRATNQSGDPTGGQPRMD